MPREKVKYTFSLDTIDKQAILLVMILLLTFIVYLPSLNNNFTNWDDPQYVYHNPSIQKFNKENVKDICFGYHMGHYHPLAMLSLAIDYSIGELNPKTYHITNLILHLCNTALVFIFILLLYERKDLAAITSAFFGVHTLNVEAVAWISERKTVLYTIFFLASLIFYLYYIKEKKNKFYILALLFFILALLSKVVAVPLAMTLIAADWLKGRNLKDRKVILEKVPFFIIALFFGIVAIFAQYGKSDPEASGYPVYDLFSKLIFASYAFCQTLYKLIIPMGLSAFYPYPAKGTIPFEFWMSLIIAILIAAAAFYSAKKSKVYLFCFLFFVFNIILVLQFVQMGRVIMTDRYAYIPSISFFLAFGIAVTSIKVNRIFIYIPIACYILFIGILTLNRCQVWHDSISLWTDVIEKYPMVDEAYNSRGAGFAKEKKHKQAIADFDQAISISPGFPRPYNNRGMSKAALKDYAGAKIDFDKLIELRPDFPDAYYNRGNVLIAMGDTLSAVKDYSKVLSINPGHFEALNNRGLARRDLKDFNGALEDFNKAIQLYPENPEVYINRAMLKYSMGDIAGAELDNQTAAKLNPSLGNGGEGNAYLQSANSKYLRKDFTGALADYDMALQNDADNAEALLKRGVTKINLNKLAGAIADLTRLISLQPDNTEAYYQRGIARNDSKDTKGAIEDFNKMLQLKPGSAEGLCSRGLARQGLNDIAGAFSDYNKAIEANPDFSEAYLSRGLLRSKQKDNKGAMADYDKAISLKPDFTIAYNARGVLKFNMRDREGACADWEKAKALGGDDKGFYERFCKE